MNAIRLMLLGLCIFTAAASDQKWKLVWADEFEGSGTPDPKKWTNEVGFIRNGEAHYYTAGRKENVRLENGKLIIEARREKFRNERFQEENSRRGREFAEYTSASLTTEGLAEWKHGRVEVRAKLPRGRGVWPAIWMLGTNRNEVGWPACGEIDIMEYVGFEPDVIHANIHTRKYNHVKKTGKGSRLKVEKPYEEFHVYAVEWSGKKIDFFVDEKNYFTYTKEADAAKDTWPFDQPHYLILNLAIGGAWGGQKGIDDSIFPARYEIDYVRVYETAK